MKIWMQDQDLTVGKSMRSSSKYSKEPEEVPEGRYLITEEILTEVMVEVEDIIIIINKRIMKKNSKLTDLE